ncbi:MAG: hypothetical protein J6P13_07805 [Kiritimatiellae bacterium]|nr:hypothetical protein [Kiritimatiellia bacterium]
MDRESRQFLLTAVWLFMRHGRRERARNVCEALVEADSRDGVAAVALADLLLDYGEAAKALETLRNADCPPSLEYAEAVLETRALKMLGKNDSAKARWRRYLSSRNGNERKWITQ